MGIEINELTRDQLPSLLELCEAVDPASAPKGRVELALAARDGDTLVGALICERGESGVPTHRVVILPEHREGNVEQRLLDKAMAKLQVQGVHKYRIDAAPSTTSPNPDDAWHAMMWGGQPDLEGARNVVRVMGRY